MPIFEYQCEKCEHRFEKLVFKGEEDHITCPECNHSHVRKLMSAASFMGASMGTCAAGAPRGFS